MMFYETGTDIFNTLIGYEVGDVEDYEDQIVVRFDKHIENVIISRKVMLTDDGLFITDDYVLDILPKQEEKETAEKRCCL